MEYEEEKRRLAEAETDAQRREAMASALASGMSLREIEEFLDRLDNLGDHHS